MFLNSLEILEAAKVAMSSGSSDGARASMILVDTGGKVSEALMIHFYEQAQMDITREIARLTNRDLVTYHVDAAKKRVSEILNRLKSKAEQESIALIRTKMIGGKILSRLRSKDKQGLSSAFDLTAPETERVQRLVDQLVGTISFVSNSAEKTLNEKIDAACIQAQTQKGITGEMIEVHYPSIDEKQSQFVQAQEHSVELMKKNQEELKRNPLGFAKRVLSQAKEMVSFMRKQYVIGRREADMIRQKTLISTAQNEARGSGLINAQRSLVGDLMKNGISAFVDRAGRRWTLGNYANMAVRTTSKQSSNMGELFDDEEHDLYIIVDKHSRCPICSRFEGRVYSRSGTNTHYPPLSDAFGKIDKNGTTSLENTYLTIHPNCRHTLAKFYEAAHTSKQLEAIRKKSNPATNPFDVDPRTKQEIDEYKERERRNAQEQESIRLYREMMMFIPVKELGSWVMFHKHFMAKDKKFHDLMDRYKKQTDKS